MLRRNKETKKLEVFSKTPRTDEMPGNRQARRATIYGQGAALDKVHWLRQEIKDVFKAEKKANPKMRQRKLPPHQGRTGKHLSGYYSQLVALARGL